MLSSTHRLLPSASSLTSSNCSIASRATSLMFSRGMTILSKDSAVEFKKENYNARMAKTRRPVSPHVTIYSFPICALASITTRVTGCALSFGAAGLGALEIVGGNGAAFSLMSDIGNSGLVLASGAKFAVAFPIVYHYLGGLRHLVWDNAPEMLTNMDVEKTSYGLIGASVLVSGVALVV
mmetsp:Transcript_20167/g.31495  ORF Transcript_20167/g.31495 Transcript_20167/m.31495 type:complete len:180 (+) Transcript_20167:96-635(+)|eukprot:CAMPEP_0201714370 /NCGR_PEP_ID=MMETSP0593-20130828/888_1 /ASSEMBLY_ACC=CAM_ASM_000672 /TAXON_ID=267983 /ORGANISM="Skeletonema japonicum, Strain CCMP2506" /LENGTH=179 /DNA_ID=CAMNT_0048203645 /DNA_START=70 /DNA_END=609 /DNA_ORIENTATION=+